MPDSFPYDNDKARGQGDPMRQNSNEFYYIDLDPKHATIEALQKIVKRPVKVVKSISVGYFFQRHRESLGLELITEPGRGGETRRIYEPTPNRPGLVMAGFTKHFAGQRVQVFGAAEVEYLRSLSAQIRLQRIKTIFNKNVPCLIFSKEMMPTPDVLEVANELGFCIFSSTLDTRFLVNALTICLEEEFAPRETVHGCMLDVRGIGVLICGVSGIGKSEASLALVERNCALVADDKVDIYNVSGKLMTRPQSVGRGYIEVRGLGFIDITRVYGYNAFRPEKELNLVVHLVPLSVMKNPMNDLDRIGLNRSSVSVLGKDVMAVQIPISAGRDAARLIELATVDYHLRTLGYSMAQQFQDRVRDRIDWNTMQEGKRDPLAPDMEWRDDL